jgi:hypothetical protein
MDQKLIQRLMRAGKRTAALRFADGTEVLCLPYGGRVLGLFAGGDARNFYWVNSALDGSATARRFFASNRWQNTGGERIWLGPEFDYFFPRYPDMSVYRRPRPLDAGLFKVTRIADGIRLVSTFAVRSHRHKATLKLRLTKSIGMAADPLRNWPNRIRMKGVHYAGYTQRTGLEFAGSLPTGAPVGLWSLTQLPQGGDMIVPTFGQAVPRLFFGRIPRNDLAVKSAIMHCHMRSGGNLKLGLKAHSVTGRVGYRYESSGAVNLVVRNFLVNPSGEYVDAPWTDSSDAGYCVQTCNVSDAGIGNFSELEYHVPAIGGATGLTRSEDVAQIWAYRGTRAQIRLIAGQLLGVSA